MSILWHENWIYDPLGWQYFELIPAVYCFILNNHVYTQYQMWFCGCCKWFDWSKWWLIVKITLLWPENWAFDPLGCQYLELFPAAYCFILKNHVYTQYQIRFFECYKLFTGSTLGVFVKMLLYWPENRVFGPPGWQYLELYPAVYRCILRNHVYTQYQMWFCGYYKWFDWSNGV